MQHLPSLYPGPELRILAIEYLHEVQRRSSKHQDNWDYTHFVNFPKRHGFGMKDDYLLYPSGVSNEYCCQMSPLAFQQEWLFFQLISCVVQNGDGPILPRKDLTCHHELQLSTGKLNEALTTWHNYLVECHNEDPETNMMRLLEATQILELAKQVVIANLAGNPAQLGSSPSEINEEDEQALCYMVLGETLSAFLVHAMKKCNVNLPGWELDERKSWGPPAYVYKKIRGGGWCSKSQASIKEQLGRNATLLYVTACAHEANHHDTRGGHLHPHICSPETPIGEGICDLNNTEASPAQDKTIPARRNHHMRAKRLLAAHMELNGALLTQVSQQMHLLGFIEQDGIDQVSSDPSCKQDLGTVAPALETHPPSHPVLPSDSGYGSALNAGKSSNIFGTSCESESLSNNALGALVEEQENEAGTDGTSDAMDDNHTVYTDNLTLSDRRLESYILALVDDLSQKIGNLFQGPEVVEELAVALPRVLKAFSCKLGYTGSSQMHRDTMVFIHKYRGAIAEMFRERHADAMDAQQNPQRLHRGRDSPVMLNRWIASSDDSNYENHPEETLGARPGNELEESLEDEPEEDDELSIPGLEEYKRMIYTDPSYQWVLGQLRREVLLSKPSKSNAMDDIRESVLAAMPGKRHVSSKTASQAVDVTYTIDCDLLAFLRGQEYDEPADVAIAQAVALTGSQADAQASSCQQYLDQTWPCTGSQTLMLIQKMLRNPDYHVPIFVSEPSACRLSASCNDGKLTISATGIPEFVAEIGEQIAWMGAALQLSPYTNKAVTECTPFIDYIRPTEGVLHCRIRFDFQPFQELSGAINGHCWHDMFRNTVIVQGFPILRRAETNTGLEMPLNMMTLLTRTRYVEEFGWKMYIKGFSTMLVPTKRSDDMIYWHLLFNKSPEERISYLDCNIEHATVQKADLETSRHVLGWCSDAVSTVGTLMADYSVSRSQLPRTHSSCALDKVEIHAGQLVTGTACFSIGNREKPVHISRHGYFTKLQWISSKWIVFWDEGEKRGWLVNGASALLHILRASLTHSKRKFESAFLMDPQDLLDPENATGANTALQLLTEEKNRNIRLYRENVEFENSNTDLGKEPETRFRYYRLENQIDHIYNMLEKLIDHQTDAERRNGLRVNPRPRRHLEGWDFKDLVTDGDPFFARVATLNALGKGWVDFTRSIHAVTLLGQGFGELIQPKQTLNGGCPQWLTLPAERYYLAARVSDLKQIMEDHGDAQTNPMKLCDDVLWLVNDAAFQSCPCGTTKPSLQHYEPVQTLFPMTLKPVLREKPLVKLKGAGAVVFGHNINIPWYWKDFGDPVKGVISSIWIKMNPLRWWRAKGDVE